MPEMLPLTLHCYFMVEDSCSHKSGQGPLRLVTSVIASYLMLIFGWLMCLADVTLLGACAR